MIPKPINVATNINVVIGWLIANAGSDPLFMGRFLLLFPR